MFKKIVPFLLIVLFAVSCKNKNGVEVAKTESKDAAKIEEPKKNDSYNVHEVPEDSEDFFEKSVQSFAGKVVFVDVWATWCQPCLISIAEMKPKKPELMKKDVVFLYYTGESSKKEDWDKMVPDISGEHYRVTAEQWKDLCTKFDIKGIPFYLIYNQKGELIHQGNSHSEELIRKINSCF